MDDDETPESTAPEPVQVELTPSIASLSVDDIEEQIRELKAQQAREYGKRGGRPKGRKDSPITARGGIKLVQSYAAAKTKSVIDRLYEIAMNGKNEAAAVKAAEIILNRAWGKPHVMPEFKPAAPATRIKVDFAGANGGTVMIEEKQQEPQQADELDESDYDSDED